MMMRARMVSPRLGTLALAVASAAVLAGCPGSSDPPPAPPAAPASLAVRPANGAAVVTFSPSAGATSYHVYYGPSAGLTTASTKVVTTGSPATVPALANGERRFFAVSAVGAHGESALSPAGCAVPTASDMIFGAAGAEMTLHDPLCADRLDGTRWWVPGAYRVRVSGGALELSVDAENMEPRRLRNALTQAGAGVNSGGKRVTTLSAQVEIPPSASRTGGAHLRSVVRLMYSPPAQRLADPSAYRDRLVLEVGLAQAAAGLYAFRNVYHCDDGACASQSSSGVAFADPQGFAPVAGTTFSGAPAGHATPYRVTATLDEATGVFHWSVAGGALGAGVSGTADPSAYLAATPSWSAVSLAGAGYLGAQLAARAFDASETGGGSAAFVARFDDVHVGFAGGAATLHDDFGGVAPNSGPEELSFARWTSAGASRVMPSGGALGVSIAVTSSGQATSFGHGLVAAPAERVRAIQADVGVPAFTRTGPGAAAATAFATVQGRFHNDGSSPASGNAVGDVFAGVFLNFTDAVTSGNYSINRCTNATCTTMTILASGPIPVVPPGAGTLALRAGYDPAEDAFSFGIGAEVVKVPAPAGAAFVAPAGAPVQRVYGVVNPSSQAGTKAALELRLNNVFTVPAAAP